MVVFLGGSDIYISKNWKQCLFFREMYDYMITDLEGLGINVNFVDIQQTNKQKWKNITKEYIKEYTFAKLEEKQQEHSKLKNIN